MHHIEFLAAAIVAATVPACAKETASIPPSHGSIAAEERAARDSDRAAGVLEKQSAKEDGSELIRCGGVADAFGSPICWSDRRLINKEDELAAQKRHEAAAHRRVSQALRDAEERACAGVPDADRVESPFAHWADIRFVQVLPDGARFEFRAVPGLEAAWLRHVVDCQLARDDALGHDVPELPYCPLVPRGATARVSPSEGGYAVEVTSSDANGAAEIVRRAQFIAAAHP
jgi:hypothetical protein